MKLIGACLIIAGCSLFGIYIAIVYKQQLAVIKQLDHLLDNMRCELEYKLTPLPVLLRTAGCQARGCIMRVFCDVADALDDQIIPDVKTCFATVLNRHNDIPPGVKSCLTELSLTLGAYDLKGQLEGISYIQNLCRQKAIELEDNKGDKLRTFRTLGVCAGAAIAVILL